MQKEDLDKKITDASKTILSYCLARTSNHYEAEDLAQDILCEIVHSATSIRDDKAFYGFMWAIAHNVYTRWCKRKQTTKEYELTEEIADSLEYVYSELDDDSDINCLRRELALLSEKYRRVTILYYIDNKSCSQIAEELLISESMVKYLLFKSRKILKEGMKMERKFGEFSYNPKKMIPMYSGEGPNHFYSYMNNLMRQNIILSCYNDSQTAEQITIETGIPLPYLDDEIRDMVAKNLLIKSGNHYLANIVVISKDVNEEINRKVSDKYEQLAKLIIEQVDILLKEYKELDICTLNFHEDTLRWQLSTLMWQMIRGYSFCKVGNPAITGWGERADIWLEEDGGELTAHTFNYCTLTSKKGDTVAFFDYLPAIKSDHRDMYGNQRKIDILCDIAKGLLDNPNEYDLEIVAELIREGYVVNESGRFTVTMPVYSQLQYNQLFKKTENCMHDDVGRMVEMIDSIIYKIIEEHTPHYLKKYVRRISGNNRFFYTVCAPAKEMIERKYLSTSYYANEMPTTYIVLKEK